MRSFDQPSALCISFRGSNEPCITDNGCRVGVIKEDIRKFISLCALDDIVQDEDGAMVAALKDHDILIFRFFVVEDLVDAEGHGLARPHLTDF